jgi:hypothetical protein
MVCSMWGILIIWSIYLCTQFTTHVSSMTVCMNEATHLVCASLTEKKNRLPHMISCLTRNSRMLPTCIRCSTMWYRNLRRHTKRTIGSPSRNMSSWCTRHDDRWCGPANAHVFMSLRHHSFRLMVLFVNDHCRHHHIIYL